MKRTRLQKEFEFLGSYYRATFYEGANIIEVEIYQPEKLFRKARYVTIYDGHIDPLRDVVEFFDKCMSEVIYKN